jgi:hypothetical protein
MKKLLIALVMMLSLVACKKDMEYKTSFDKSNKTWKHFKSSSNNSYRFVATAGSWVGISWATTIKVVNGIAVERKFTYTVYASVFMPPTGWTPAKEAEILTTMNITAAEFRERNGKDLIDFLTWTETGAMVGTHKNTPANTYLTLDEVYAKVKNDWLKKRSGTTTYFETKNNGMVSSCGYVTDNCADDCFNGINISLIEAL